MKRLTTSLFFLSTFLATAASQALGQSMLLQPDDERKERIAENLKYRFAQLRGAQVVVDELGPSSTPGFDEGTVTIGGRNRMRFLTTSDDSRLYLLAADPIDASLSIQEIALELEKERLELQREARDRHRELLAESEGLPIRGRADAPVTIVEFSDFECPYCARASSTIEQVLEKYADQVRLVYRHFPLSRHRWAEPAAIASVCTARQSADAFWTLHDNFFENQAAVSADNYVEKSAGWIDEYELDMDRWNECSDDPSSAAYESARQQVRDDMASGRRFGVSGTPAFFINGRMISGNQPVADFDKLIAEALEELQ